jgi:molecular chaperone GrpE
MTEEKDNRTNVSAGQDPSDNSNDNDINDIIEGEVIDEGTQDNGPQENESVMSKEFNELTEELQQAQNKAKEFFEGWQRERADFANYKRRIDRDQQSLAQNIKGDVMKKYLTVLDDLERAMKNRPTEGQADSWANGIELIMRKLQNILEADGVKRIPAETEQFDPTRHEAITYEESPDHKGGEIIEVVQQGYTLGDRILRPALVRVARG